MNSEHQVALEASISDYVSLLHKYERGCVWDFRQLEEAKSKIADVILNARGIALHPITPPLVVRMLNGDGERMADCRLDSPRFIYLMLNRRNGLCKIGLSRNPKAREATLQSEEPELQLLGSWPGTLRQEQDVHQRFEGKRVRGEWFDLSEEDRAEVVEAIKGWVG